MTDIQKSTVWHPFTQHGLGVLEAEIDRAEGAVLYRPDGSEIIDAISSWWVITHGHCHPEIVKAVQQQAGQLDQIIFAGFTHQPAQKLADKIIDFAGDPYKHVFFSDSGSTAVEVAMKMAIGYWQHRGEKRTKVIALEGAYHGDTFGTMAAGERCVFNAIYDPYLFDVIHIPVPVAGQEDQAIAALEAVLHDHGSDTAFFIFEPLVQGAGGMRMYSPDMLRTMCDMCQRHDILLLADEVMTGFGRTGTVFACEQAGVKPDLMAISKGLTAGFLPLGATVTTRAIYDAFYHADRAKMFFHSSSFTGNPMACAAAYAALSLWGDGSTQDKIDRVASSHRQFARRLETNQRVSQVRQTGTIIALEVIQDDQVGYLANIGQDLYKYALERGVLLRALGSVIYILPPYCITQQQLEKIYGVIESFLTER